MRLSAKGAGAYRDRVNANEPARELGRVRRTYRFDGVIVVIFALLVGVAAGGPYAKVAVACSRSTARDLRCTVETRTDLYTKPALSTHDLPATRSFHRATFAMGSGKNRRVYDRLFVDTDRGRVLLVEGRELASVHVALEAFRTEPARATVTAVAEQRALTAFLLCLALAMFSGGAFAFGFVTTTVSFTRGRVRIERRRGPFRSTNDLRVADVLGIGEESGRGARIVLERRDGTRVPLFAPAGDLRHQLTALLALAQSTE